MQLSRERCRLFPPQHPLDELSAVCPVIKGATSSEIIAVHFANPGNVVWSNLKLDAAAIQPAIWRAVRYKDAFRGVAHLGFYSDKGGLRDIQFSSEVPPESRQDLVEVRILGGLRWSQQLDLDLVLVDGARERKWARPSALPSRIGSRRRGPPEEALQSTPSRRRGAALPSRCSRTPAPGRPQWPAPWATRTRSTFRPPARPGLHRCPSRTRRARPPP